MKIVIEVSGGCVQSVYTEGPIPADVDVIVVDLDGLKAGEPVTAESFQTEPLHDAPDEVKEALS